MRVSSSFLWILLGWAGVVGLNALALNLPALSMPATDISQLQFLPPAPPSTDAPSGRARGGASRGGCAQVQSQLTALSPVAVTSQQRTSVWGLTTVAQPTLWAYMPYTQGQTRLRRFCTAGFVGRLAG